MSKQFFNILLCFGIGLVGYHGYSVFKNIKELSYFKDSTADYFMTDISCRELIFLRIIAIFFGIGIMIIAKLGFDKIVYGSNLEDDN